MISKWKVSNFKSIRKETELEFGPLTIFAGANSSGKSTLIQSILLVAQSLAQKLETKPFVLNGALAHLGQFKDLKSNGAESDQITIKCTLQPIIDQNFSPGWKFRQSVRRAYPYSRLRYLRNKPIDEISCEVSFDADASGIEGDLSQLQPELFSTQLSCKLTDRDNVEQNLTISVQRSKENKSETVGTQKPTEDTDESGDDTNYDVQIDDHLFDEVKENLTSAKAVGCQFRHFLPDKIVVEFDPNEALAREITSVLIPARLVRPIPRVEKEIDFFPKEVIDLLRELLAEIIDFDGEGLFKSKRGNSSTEKEVSFEAWIEFVRNLPFAKSKEIERVLREQQDLDDLIRKAMAASSKRKRKHTEDPEFTHLPIPFLLRFSAKKIEEFFVSGLKYLGPLRDAPKTLYPLVHVSDPDNVGLRGEHSASILELHKNKKVDYIPSESFRNSDFEPTSDNQRLETAVNDWLQYLEVADIVISEIQGKYGRELKVRSSDSDQLHDLTQVGVGVSQVLPILVMCLLAEPGSTLVFEQPELHLHPKVQTLLGDFFLSMALCGKQCIVETHSEYLIDRLRFRIASANNEQELNSKAKIYFVEQTSEGSSFQEVVINEYGAISNWPQGFFDQSQHETQKILLAAAKKRKANLN